MGYGRPLFTLRVINGEPNVEILNVSGFSYTGNENGRMAFRRYWKDPQDETFQRLNEVNTAIERHEGLAYTNVVRVERRGYNFEITCFFEGPVLSMLNGKKSLVRTEKNPDFFITQDFREVAEKLIGKELSC